MKKTLSFVLFILLFTAGPLMAQKQLYFGLGGTGLSSFIMNQNNYGLFEMDYKVTFGGSGNINIGFDFNKHIGLKLEAGYAKLGQKYEDSRLEKVSLPTADATLADSVATYTRNVKLNYLQIPVMFKYRTNGEVARFYLMAGPQFNLLLSAKQDYLRNGSLYVNDTIYNLADVKIDVGKESVKERYSSLDIMARIDLGVDITIVKNLLLNVGLTMAYGLMDINATDWRLKDNSGAYHASHNVYGGINVGINYLLPLGSK